MCLQWARVRGVLRVLRGERSMHVCADPPRPSLDPEPLAASYDAVVLRGKFRWLVPAGFIQGFTRSLRPPLFK